MLNVLLTGPTGFIGKALLKHLLEKQEHNAASFSKISVATRKKLDISCPQYLIGDLSGSIDWAEVLESQDVVIHAAGRAHVLHESSQDSGKEYIRVNTDATLNLAQQAADTGVKRFVYLSSIGVNGHVNTSPFSVGDPSSPTSLYAESKWKAEQGLWSIQKATGMQVVILRPPLAYGPSAPGNFHRLIQWVERGIPLPLGAVYNKRTLVGVDNLVDLIRVCIDHPAAANRVILAGDDEDVSTTQILRGIAEGMGRPSRLIPVPESLLWAGASVLGKKTMAEKVLGSLQVDISETKRLLDWEPPYSFAEGMQRCFE
ncbi:NAD-dependent epimerase/dehydratase family protein [Marinobacterium stanieri]|uniref:NAD-dependent epimerase/dehydratase family protein n=1 Tax=Marinobacterium stanieri TaxID=49186 RepID=UPI003A8E3DCD